MILVAFARQGMSQPVQPNFLVVVVDDAEFNMLRPYVPDFVQQPGMDSIASKGAIVQMDNVQSYCNPSRYSMLTGLYPHNHGATDNATPVNPSFTLLTRVLSNHDYHVAIDGKFTNTTGTKTMKGIERWWITLKDKYTNASFYDATGTEVIMAGHATQIIHDTATVWLSNLQPPFFLWMGELLPHRKPVPTTANKDLYEGQPISLPATFFPYSADYPSFLYYDDAKFYTNADSALLKESIQLNYECLNDLSDFLLKAVEILRTRGLLENTFIMIVGDNGFMNGEHMLYGKNAPYNEAMRVPCLIRYAPWFTPGTVVDYTGFQSIDFASTILDAAGIDDPSFINQSLGKSLRYLMEPGNQRPVQYFEKIKRVQATEDEEDGVDSLSPSFRSVKTQAYKYIRYNCDSLTEELFDLAADPMETVNQAKNPFFALIMNEYRMKLDSLSVALNDTVSGDTILRHCKLISPIGTEVWLTPSSGEELVISPNPVNQLLRIKMVRSVNATAETRLKLFNAIGQLLMVKKFPATLILETTISTASLPDGLYFLSFESETRTSLHPFVVTH
jgi:N-acetylglucosamine-6-sulfatase